MRYQMLAALAVAVGVAPESARGVTLLDQSLGGRAAAVEFLPARMDVDANPTTKDPSGFYNLRDTQVVGQSTLTMSSLFELQVWVRVGNGAELSLADHELIGGPTLSDLDGDPGSEFVSVTYRLPGFYDITLTGELISPSDGTPAGLYSEMLLTNTSGGPLDLHFFSFWDIDLADLGTGLGEVIEFPIPTAFFHSEDFTMTSPPNGLPFTPPNVFRTLSQVLVQDLGGSVEFVGSEASTRNALLARLEDGSATTLTGASAVDESLTKDLVGAFHNRVLGLSDGGTVTFVLSPFSEAVPEPQTWALLAVGATALTLRRQLR
jgi:hypothetical protein